MGFLLVGGNRTDFKRRSRREKIVEPHFMRAQFTFRNKWIMVFTDWVRGWVSERRESLKTVSINLSIKMEEAKIKMPPSSGGWQFIVFFFGTLNLSSSRNSKFKIPTWNQYVFGSTTWTVPDNEYGTFHRKINIIIKVCALFIDWKPPLWTLFFISFYYYFFNKFRLGAQFWTFAKFWVWLPKRKVKLVCTICRLNISKISSSIYFLFLVSLFMSIAVFIYRYFHKDTHHQQKK